MCAGALALIVVLAGCRRGNFGNENDLLRARVLELESEVAALSRRGAELEAQVADRSAAPGDVPADVPADVAAATPHLASVDLGRWSHARDEDGDGRPDVLELHVRPRDGRGRFVQVAGTLDVHAAVLPVDGPSVTIARARLEPLALRDAYRSGFAGTHYTVRVPIDVAALPPDAAAALVRVVVTDGRTGRAAEVADEIGLE